MRVFRACVQILGLGLRLFHASVHVLGLFLLVPVCFGRVRLVPVHFVPMCLGPVRYSIPGMLVCLCTCFFLCFVYFVLAYIVRLCFVRVHAFE